MRQLFRDTAAYGATDLVARVVAFAFLPILAALFTVEQFGVIVLVTTLVYLASLLCNPGLNTAVQRLYFEPGIGDQRRATVLKSGFTLLVGWSLGAAVVSLAAFLAIEPYLPVSRRIEAEFVVLAILIAPLAQVVLYAQDLLRLRFAPFRFGLVSVLRNLAGLTLAVVFAYFLQSGVSGYFWGQIAGALILIPVALLLVRDQLRGTGDSHVRRELLGLGYPLAFAGLAGWLLSSLDVWMLAQLATVEEAGRYGIASRVATLVAFVSATFGQAWSPHALRAHAEQPGYREQFGRLFSSWCFFMVVVSSALMLFSSEVFMLFTPEVYWPSAAVASCLGAAAGIAGTVHFTALGLSIEKRSSLISACVWGAALVNLCLDLLLIPALGAVGASLAAVLTQLVLTGSYLGLSQRLHPVPINWRQLGLIGAVFSGVAVLGVYLAMAPWHPLVTGIKFLVMIGLVYLGNALALLPVRRIAGLITEVVTFRK